MERGGLDLDTALVTLVKKPTLAGTAIALLLRMFQGTNRPPVPNSARQTNGRRLRTGRPDQVIGRDPQRPDQPYQFESVNLSVYLISGSTPLSHF